MSRRIGRRLTRNLAERGNRTVTASPSQIGFAALAARPYADVLIIGGGINGLAAFRDLVLQGVDVALVERGDIVSGASSASSHMIHGGIRYLENGEFRLVHEAVTERNALMRIAPHYVRPLQTTIPIFTTFSGILGAPLRFLRHGRGRPAERGAVLIKVGLMIYDSFSRGGGRVPRHTFHGRRRSLRELPHLHPTVRYTATYWDASLHDPERLAVDVLRDALALGGTGNARAATYTAAVATKGAKVVVRDVDSGDEVAFAASVVVNATGPWTDLTNAALGETTRFMGGTKGSHIVLDHPELLEATGGRELFFEHSDGRIVLIYPLKERVLVGTTDLEHEMTEPMVCTEAEVDYFLELIGHVLPGIPVDRSHIVHRFAGVRPLPGHGGIAPGFVSRDYRIEQTRMPVPDGPRIVSLVGGKWTTFRASAESVADRVLTALHRPRLRSTRRMPIGGGRGYPTTPRARAQWISDHASGFDPTRAARLHDRYGTIAAEVIAAIATDPDDAPLAGAPTYSTGELRHLARTEAVRHLDDLLLRRTSLAFTGDADAAARAVAEAVAPVLGWDAETISSEIARARAAVHAAEPRSEDAPQFEDRSPRADAPQPAAS